MVLPHSHLKGKRGFEGEETANAVPTTAESSGAVGETGAIDATTAKPVKLGQQKVKEKRFQKQNPRPVKSQGRREGI